MPILLKAILCGTDQLGENQYQKKFALKLFNVEPSRTLNGAFYFSFPNTA